MFCTECGKTLEVGAAACTHCNALVEDASTDMAGADMNSSNQPADELAADALASHIAKPVRNIEAPPPAIIAFGDWQVRELAVISSRGMMPLDQVSCSTYDQEPRNIRNIAIGALIALGGLYAFTMNGTAGILIGLVGAVILFLSLQTKRSFRLYSTSGYYFEGISEEIDMGNNVVQDFQRFNAALVDYRDRYLLSLKG